MRKPNMNHEQSRDSINIPIFTVLNPDGSKTASLIGCHIDRIILNLACPPSWILSRNGYRYQVIYDNVSVDQAKPVAKVIISYQRHTYGNFAVVRIMGDGRY